MLGSQAIPQINLADCPFACNQMICMQFLADDDIAAQAHFQRDRDQMSREEEEEYEQACEDSMFRIHILDKRLKRHEEAALQSYYELDNKLRHDPRLAVLIP